MDLHMAIVIGINSPRYKHQPTLPRKVKHGSKANNKEY